MTEPMTPETSTADREIVLTRLVNAPPALVFEAWTNSEHVSRWWGPRGFTTTTHEMDLRPDGVWRHTMHGPDGVDYPDRIIYREVVRPERLVYDLGSDLEDDPGQIHVTVTFDDREGKTCITMRLVFASAAEREMVVEQHHAIEGGNQHLDRLEEYLATMA